MSSWADSVADSGNNGGRPTRPAYVPPHQRNNFAFTPHDSFHSHRNRARGGGGVAANGGNGRRPRETNTTNNNANPNPSPSSKLNANADPFDVADQFGGLRVKEEAGEGGINFDAYDDIPVETSGNDVPKAVTTFAEIDLGGALNENIRRCKYVKPTPVQRFAIPIAIAGRDLMACAQTGSGKTAAFCFPIISGIMTKQAGQRVSRGGVGRGGTACPLALILSPTRELSIQIFEEIKKFSFQTNVKVSVAYGGAPMMLQLRELEKGVDILVATPGRLVDLIERARVSLRSINYLALDEADRMLDMGFEHQIRKIVEQMDMPRPGARQTMLFSATFPTEIQRLASDFLSNYIFLAVGRVGSSTGLIEQRVEFVEDMNKRGFLMDLLYGQRQNGSKQPLTVVFVETKRGADSLEHWLSGNGFPATAIHGDKIQMERERALRSFKNGHTPILVATDVAARGLDIPHVAHVINFDLPKDIDDYVHRIGRTGRAGKSGLATAFFNEANHHMAKALAELMQESNQVVPPWLSDYAQRPSYGGGGRNRRYGGGGGGGGGRFGAYDYRRDSFSGGGGYSSNSSYAVDTTNTYPYPSAPAPSPTPALAPAPAPAPTPTPYIYDYTNGPIVATGWD